METQRSTSNYHVEGRGGAGFWERFNEKVKCGRDVLKYKSKFTRQTQRGTPADNIMNKTIDSNVTTDSNFSMNCY